MFFLRMYRCCQVSVFGEADIRLVGFEDRGYVSLGLFRFKPQFDEEVLGVEGVDGTDADDSGFHTVERQGVVSAVDPPAVLRCERDIA